MVSDCPPTRQGATMSDELARLMLERHQRAAGDADTEGEFTPPVPWAELEDWAKEWWLDLARAVRDHYGIPESAEPGAVGKAVEAWQAECGRCNVKSLCCTCAGAEVLHALGVGVK